MDASAGKSIFANNLRYYMCIKGVSNTQLCADLGFKYTTFMDWINGKTYPRMGKVELLANYFGCEKSDLIEEKDRKSTEDDGLSEQKKALIEFVNMVPEDKAELVLRVMRLIVEAD